MVVGITGREIVAFDPEPLDVGDGGVVVLVREGERAVGVCGHDADAVGVVVHEREDGWVRLRWWWLLLLMR